MELKVLVVIAVVLIALFSFGFLGLLPNPLKKTVKECEDQPGSLLKDVCYALKARNEKSYDWCNSISAEATKAKCTATVKLLIEGKPAETPAAPAGGEAPETPAEGSPETPAVGQAGGQAKPPAPKPKTLADAKVADLVPKEADFAGEFKLETEGDYALSAAGYLEGKRQFYKKTEETGGSTTVEVKVLKFQSQSPVKDFFTLEKGKLPTSETVLAFDEGLKSVCYAVKFDGGVIQKTTNVVCRNDVIAFTLFIESKDTSKRPEVYIELFGKKIEERLDKALK